MFLLERWFVYPQKRVLRKRREREREREKSSYEEVKTTLSKTAIILLDFTYAHTRTHTSSFRSVSHYTSFRRQGEDVLTTTLSLETLKNIIGEEKQIQKYTHNGFIM